MAFLNKNMHLDPVLHGVVIVFFVLINVVKTNICTHVLTLLKFSSGYLFWRTAFESILITCLRFQIKSLGLREQTCNNSHLLPYHDMIQNANASS